jgi:very-short-patch-repair endonuclease
MEYDAKRTTFLNEVGIQVLRFTNNEVFENSDNILEIIRKNLDNHP